MNTDTPRKRRGLWPAFFLIFIGLFFLLQSFHIILGLNRNRTKKANPTIKGKAGHSSSINQWGS